MIHFRYLLQVVYVFIVLVCSRGTRNFEVIPLEGYNVDLYEFPIAMTANFYAGKQKLKVALMTTYPITELNCTSGGSNYVQSKSTTASNIPYSVGCAHAKFDEKVCGYVVPSAGRIVIGHFLKDRVYFGDLTPDDDDFEKYSIEFNFACKDHETYVAGRKPHRASIFSGIQGVVGLKSMTFPSRQLPMSYLDKLFSLKEIDHNMFSLCFATTQDRKIGSGRMILGGYDSRFHKGPLKYTSMVKKGKLQKELMIQLNSMVLSFDSTDKHFYISNKTLTAVLASGDPVCLISIKMHQAMVAGIKQLCSGSSTCYEAVDLKKEKGTVCYKMKDPLKSIKSFPKLVLNIQGIEAIMMPEDYLYPVSSDLQCLNFFPFDPKHSHLPEDIVILGIRFFQNRDIVFDNELSLIGIADATNCTSEIAPDAIVLQEGVPQLSATANSTFKYFRYIPKDLKSPIVIALDALDGDPDLYISWSNNLKPTREKNDAKSNWRQKLEYIVINPKKLTQSSKINIGVYGYHSNVKFSIVVYEENKRAVLLLDAMPMIGFVTESKPMHFLFQKSRTLTHPVEFTLLPETGDPNVYIRATKTALHIDNVPQEQWPTRDAWSWSSTNPNQDDDYIRISDRGNYSSFLVTVDANGNSSFYITASTTSSTTALHDGKAQRFHVEFNSYRYFSFFASKPGTAVNIDVTNEGSGDPDLYVSCFIKPTGTDHGVPSSKNYTWSSSWTGPDSVFIEPDNPCTAKSDGSSGAMFYIAVKGFRKSDFTLLVSTSDGPMVQLRNNVPQQGLALSGRYRFYNFTLPQNSQQVTISTATAGLGSLQLVVSSRTIDNTVTIRCDSKACACRCNPFGAKGLLGYSPGCGYHTQERTVQDAYCYVSIPEKCDSKEVHMSSSTSAHGISNKYRKCDLLDLDAQVPILENAHSYEQTSDGSSKVCIENSKLSHSYFKLVINRRNLTSNHIVIGVKGLVSTLYRLTVSTLKQVPFSLSNGIMSPQHFLRAMEIELFEFMYLESGDASVAIALTAYSGEAKLFVSRRQESEAVTYENAWLQINSDSYVIDASNPCAESKDAKSTEHCESSKLLSNGKIIFGVKNSAQKPLIFSLTVTLLGNATQLYTGIAQFSQLNKDVKGNYAANFIYRASKNDGTFLQINTETKPADKSSFCSLKVTVTRFKDKHEKTPESFVVSTMSEVTKYFPNTERSQFQIHMQANDLKGCEPRVPFHITMGNKNDAQIIQNTCFKANMEQSFCRKNDTILKGEKRVYNVLEETDSIRFEACKGELSIDVCAKSIGESKCQDPTEINKNYFVSGIQGGMFIFQDLNKSRDSIKLINVNIQNLGEKDGSFDLILTGHSTALIPGGQLSIKAGSKSASISWIQPNTVYATEVVHLKNVVYDIYWWKVDGPLNIGDSVLNTPCGLENVAGIKVKRNIQTTEYTIPDLETEGKYYVNVVAKCIGEGTCGNGIPAQKVAYKQEYVVIPSRNGGLIIALVLLSSVALTLAIPAIISARRLYREKSVLKRQLEYEMHDVRNVIALDNPERQNNMVNEESKLLDSDTEYRLEQN